MEKEIYNIPCIKENQENDALIELTENENGVEIKFSLDELVLKKEGDNYFETLIKIRQELEKKNIKLLCKGCSYNVYPSAMILDMGTGRKAYTLTHGEQAKMDSLVDIFDSCLLEEYATIKQQLEYFEKWTISLRR